ncbi:MAG: hypothetical protein KBA26_05480 [Candidatus Delongbacteria bacterium]|nr:hypothetical protein [Candidatus Delongbacteria bacterium]
MSLVSKLSMLIVVLAGVISADNLLKINSENLAEYRLSLVVGQARSNYVCVQDISHQKVLKIELDQVYDGPINILIKKQGEGWSGKCWNPLQAEPMEWNAAVKAVIPSKESDYPSADFQQVVLRPLHVTSINSSWGRIKYLFNNN